MNPLFCLENIWSFGKNKVNPRNFQLLFPTECMFFLPLRLMLLFFFLLSNVVFSISSRLRGSFSSTLKEKVVLLQMCERRAEPAFSVFKKSLLHHHYSSDSLKFKPLTDLK